VLRTHPVRPRPKTSRGRRSPCQPPKLGLRSKEPLAAHSARCSKVLPLPSGPHRGRPPGHAAPRAVVGSGGREATFAFLVPRVTLAPEDHLAMVFRHPTGRAPGGADTQLEHAVCGTPPATLPPLAASLELDRRRSDTHHHEPNPLPSAPGQRPGAASWRTYSRCRQKWLAGPRVVPGTSCAESPTLDRRVREYPQTTGTDLDRLPWGCAPYDASRSGQRPTPGLPHPAVLRLQVFSTS